MIATAVSTALVFVLASVSIAQAECAWVLWRTAFFDRAETHIEPVRGHKSFDACERERAESIRDDRRLRTSVPVTYSCLPDTIDPRGPKGGR